MEALVQIASKLGDLFAHLSSSTGNDFVASLLLFFCSLMIVAFVYAIISGIRIIMLYILAVVAIRNGATKITISGKKSEYRIPRKLSHQDDIPKDEETDNNATPISKGCKKASKRD